MFDLSVLFFLVKLNFSESILNGVKFALVMFFVVDVEGSYEVNNLVAVFDGVDPPVVDNEFKLRDFSVAVSNFSIGIERLSHDSNKHVKKMSHHENRHGNEEYIKDWTHRISSKL